MKADHDLSLRLENQLCFPLYACAKEVTRKYKPFLDPLGLTYTQYIAMMVLWETDNQPVNDIAHKLLLETNTVTPLIQRMEKMGLVIRTRGMVDSRQRIVSLTKEGKSMEKEAAKVPQCMLNHFSKCGLSKEEVFQLVPLLDKLIDSLKDHTKDSFENEVEEK